MHENNFEKQVREKMDELGLDPPDTVWEAVHSEIKKDRKRRRPLFWLFFLSGLTLSGGAYYFYGNHSRTGPVENQTVKTATDNAPSSQPENKAAENYTTENPGTKSPGETSKEKVAAEKLANQVAASKKPGDAHRETVATLPGNDLDLRNKSNNPAQKNAPVGQNADKVTSSPTQDNKRSGTAAPVTAAAAGAAISQGGEQALAKNDAKPSGETKSDSAHSTVKDSAAIAGSKPEKASQKKSHGWKFGLTGSAGVSNVNQDLFKSINSADANMSAAPSAPVPVGSSNNYSSSEVRAGFSYGFGVFANRELSNRVSLTAGIKYQYYSTEIKAGSYVPNASNFYSSYARAGTVNAYYNSGNSTSYTNKYHFLELPVTANFQLNKSKTVPVTWEAGFSLGFLLSSNALFYDPNANVYFESDQLMNKTQFSGLTALMVGFPLGKSEMQAGPQLQYGITGLLNSSTANPGHLLYYGLKVSYTLFKK